MANYIEVTTIAPTRFVPPTSRYADATVIYYSEKKKITYSTYKKHSFTTNDNDQFMLLTKGVEYRPDLVSFDLFGTCDFWWRIMEANGMKDILEFKAGVTIRIPNNLLV